MLVSIVFTIGNPTGVGFFSHFTNIGKVLVINGVLIVMWTFLMSAILSFLYIPLPRILLASLSYTIFASIFVLIYEDSGILFSIIIGISYSLLSFLITLFLIVLFNQKKHRIIKLAVMTAITIASFLVYEYVVKDKYYIDVPAVAEIDSEGPTLENPSQIGEYSYQFLSYGSGNDKYREEFGELVGIKTPTVDASHFITRWSDKRESFWGFDQSQLPVNGRLWLPEGDGPFPVILMVHGNHTMEDFSTSGYDYLGELLASRGFIAASVDEDFINYSNTSGIPNNNYELRAWMLLKHLVQLDELNQTPGNELYQKLDMKNVGLVGHSRGGQAVSMVGDYKRFFDDNHLLNDLENINVKGIVAIAPTDKRLDGNRPVLENTPYLIIQGAQDADINNFRGDHQFYRSTFDEDSDSFKASVYIAGANHGQFNTEWGNMDVSLPKGLFLNQGQIMDPEDQRQIAKVYISAFFERTIHENQAYEKLFRNHQYGKNWLPESLLVTKYQNPSYLSLLDFKRNRPNPATGVIISSEGFTVSDVIKPKDRRNNNRPEDAIQLEWENEAKYTINLSNVNKKVINNQEHVVFTMANNNENGSIPEIEIQLETTDGVSVQLPLNSFMAFPPVISSEFTPFGLFDDIFRDGKYENSWEPVFQTFEIPFQRFESENPEFNKNNVNSITLLFHTQQGNILIESVGLSQ